MELTHLALIHEGQHRLEIGEVDSSHVEERVLVGILPEDVAEEWAAGGDDHLVSFNLVVITGKSYVEKVLLIPELPKGPADVGLEVIPLEAELLRAHGLSVVFSLWFVTLLVLSSVVRTGRWSLHKWSEIVYLQRYFSVQYGARLG